MRIIAKSVDYREHEEYRCARTVVRRLFRTDTGERGGERRVDEFLSGRALRELE